MKAFRGHNVTPLQQSENSRSPGTGANASANSSIMTEPGPHSENIDTDTVSDSEAYLPCTLHSGHVLNSFCVTCDELVCSACLCFLHSGHHFARVSDHMKAARSEMLQNRASVETLLSSLQSQLALHQADLLTIPAQQSFLSSTFEQQADALASTVVSSAENVCSRIADEYTRKCSVLNEHCEAVSDALGRQEHLMSAVASVAKDEGNLQVKAGENYACDDSMMV